MGTKQSFLTETQFRESLQVLVAFGMLVFFLLVVDVSLALFSEKNMSNIASDHLEFTNLLTGVVEIQKKIDSSRSDDDTRSAMVQRNVANDRMRDDSRMVRVMESAIRVLDS